MSIYGHLLLEKIDIDFYKNYNDISDVENKIARLIHNKVFLQSKDEIYNIPNMDKFFNYSGNLYPLYTIKENKHGSSGVSFYNGEFTSIILFLHFETFINAILKKDLDKYKVNDSDIVKFIDFCNNISEKIASILEPKYNWLKINKVSVDKNEIKKVATERGFDYISIDISLSITDEFASKLLHLDKSDNERFNIALSKISDKEKENAYNTYNQCIEWLKSPKTIDGKSHIYFADILYVCKLIGYNNSKLISLIKNGTFKSIDAKELVMDEYSIDDIKRMIGDSALLINDLRSWGAGECVIFAKNKLWYINHEHTEVDDISRFPYSTENFTKYAYEKDDIVKAILKPYDEKKGYNLIK